MVEVAEGTTATTQEIVRMVEDDRRRIQALGRSAATALALHDLSVRQVVLTAARAATSLGVSEPTAYGAIGRLERLGVLREMTGRRRDRVYAYGRYLDLLSEGTG